MRAFFPILCAILLAAAWLLPFHKTPWTTFGSELLTFLAALSLLGLFVNSSLKIPKPQWFAALFITIPLIQWSFGQVLYFSNALLITAYLLMFWLMTVAGYQLSVGNAARETVFKRFSLLVVAVGLLSSVIAICQWLDLSQYFTPYMNLLKGNRPYANFAQPNNLATFLTISVLGCVYLFEKRLLPKRVLIPVALLFVFCIALTQSRTSWVVGLFMLAYWGIKQYRRPMRFNFAKMLAWIASFVAIIVLLPELNAWLASFSEQDVITTSSVVERASSGYLRFDMWNQSLVALSQQPWFGYGWNQTGMAQIAAFDAYPSHEWYKSSHNFALDLLVWNGIPIGGLILLYLICWLFWLNRGEKESISMTATLMVCAILIHGLLEYPLHYAYFLLPMGFLLGLIQAQYPKLPSVQVPRLLLSVVILIGLTLTAVVYRDYDLYKQQSAYASKKLLSPEQQAVMQRKIWVLTQFEERVWWIHLDPQEQMTDAELQHVARVVANSASAYDLHKYAQLLAYNHKKTEAEHQLWIIKQLHGQSYEYAQLSSNSSTAD